MRFVVGCDHAGVALRDEIKAWLHEDGHEVVDLGTTTAAEAVDYPDIAHAVAASLRASHAHLGVLVCGSGVGMSIAANRHASVRAVVCTEATSARLAREHNDANILCLGQRLVGVALAKDIVRAFIEGRFAGGRHAGRVAKIECAS